MTQSPLFYSAVFALFEDGAWNILLSKRENTWWNDGWYTLPSGHVEWGELPSEAMIREAVEETAVRPTKWEHISTLFRIDTRRTYIDFFYRVSKWGGEIRNLEPEKCSELAWFPRHSLPQNIIPFVREVIERAWEQSYFEETRVEDKKSG